MHYKRKVDYISLLCSSTMIGRHILPALLVTPNAGLSHHRYHATSVLHLCMSTALRLFKALGFRTFTPHRQFVCLTMILCSSHSRCLQFAPAYQSQRNLGNWRSRSFVKVCRYKKPDVTKPPPPRTCSVMQVVHRGNNRGVVGSGDCRNDFSL